jgi:tryptophan-rich sensory protein
MRRRYVFPPLFYLCVAYAGSYFTRRGLGEWYALLVKPDFTPSGAVISTAWTIIYVLAALSFILFLNDGRRDRFFRFTTGLFVFNGILNVLWSFLFFRLHALAWSAIGAGLIAFTTILMIILVRPSSPRAGLLLVPYAAWSCFATYLNVAIYHLNPHSA